MARSRSKRKSIDVRLELQPTEQQCSIIQAIEDDPEVQGLSIDAWAALLLELLPGPVNGYYHGLPVDEPTRALGGSKEKVAVFRRRIKMGMELHHPKDTKRKLTELENE